MASAQTTAQKELFLSKLQVKGEEFQLGGLGTERSQFLTESKHKEIVECLAEWESRSDNKKERLSKFPQGYAWRNKYALFGPDDSAVLIFNPEFVGRGKTKEEALPNEAAAPAAAQALDEAQVVSHEGRVFEDLLKIHLEGGHCKAKTFCERVKRKHGKSIPEKLIYLFVSCCPICTEQKPRKPTSAGHKPILTRGLGSRGQVDLIDFQSCADSSFKYLLNYQARTLPLPCNRPRYDRRTAGDANVEQPSVGSRPGVPQRFFAG